MQSCKCNTTCKVRLAALCSIERLYGTASRGQNKATGPEAKAASARALPRRGLSPASKAGRKPNNNEQHSSREYTEDREAAGIAAQGAILPKITKHPNVGTKSPVSVQSETTPRDLTFSERQRRGAGA